MNNGKWYASGIRLNNGWAVLNDPLRISRISRVDFSVYVGAFFQKIAREFLYKTLFKEFFQHLIVSCYRIETDRHQNTLFSNASFHHADHLFSVTETGGRVIVIHVSYIFKWAVSNEDQKRSFGKTLEPQWSRQLEKHVEITELPRFLDWNAAVRTLHRIIFVWEW